MPGTTRNELAKTLNPIQALALALGTIIGWGCFILPGLRFLPEAGPLGTIIAFIIGAFFQCVIALNYSALIGAYPVAGGAFAYAYAGFGPRGAFVCGWALALSYMCALAASAMSLIPLSRHLLPGVFNSGFLYSVAGWNVYAGELALVSAILLIFACLNYRGISTANAVQVILSLTIALGVLALAVATFTSTTAQIHNLQPLFAEIRSPLSCILLVLAITPWLYVGFDTIPLAAEEFKFSVARARGLMLAAIICGALLYTLVTLSVAGLIPYPQLLAQNHQWATGRVAELAFGRMGGIIIAIPALAAILTGINGFFMATVRTLFSMGRSRFLPPWFSSLHPVFATPCNSVVFTTLFCLALPWLGHAAMLWIVDMSSIGTSLAYLFTSLTALKYLRNSPPPKSATLSMALCIVGALISLTCIMILLWPASPAALAIPSWLMLLAWLALGFLFYHNRKTHIAHSPMQSYLLFGREDIPLFFKAARTDKPKPTL